MQDKGLPMTTTSKLINRARALSWVLSLGLIALAAAAQPPVQQESIQEEPVQQQTLDHDLIEQILALQKQIDELTSRLSPEARQALQARRLAATTGTTSPESMIAAGTADSVPADSVPADTVPADSVPANTAPAEAVSAETGSAEAATPKTGAAETEAYANGTTAPELSAAEGQTAGLIKTSPAVDPATAPGPLPLLKKRRPRPTCNTLTLLDENEDGQINSADRHWRHLFVWVDKNSDGQMHEKEIKSAFERGVREIAASLGTFVRAKGGLGETRLQGQVILDLSGDGFSERNRRDDGILVLDATAIRRGQGLELLGPDKEALAGFQAFRSGLQIRESTGKVTALTCP